MGTVLDPGWPDGPLPGERLTLFAAGKVLKRTGASRPVFDVFALIHRAACGALSRQ